MTPLARCRSGNVRRKEHEDDQSKGQQSAAGEGRQVVHWYAGREGHRDPAERPSGMRNARRDRKRRWLGRWPHKPGAAGAEGITISARRYGFEIKGAGHVVIQGLRILRQGGDQAAGIVKSG